MKLIRFAAPAGPAYDVPSLITWLNVVRDDEHTLLDELGAAAQSNVETYLQRALITQTWDLILPCFRSVITLPFPPLQTIVSVQYIDLAGATQTLTDDHYEFYAPTDEFCDPGELRPTYLELWPETRPTWNAVQIRFRCGYGATPDLVPAGIRKAIDRLVEEQYRIRGITTTTAAGAREKPIEGGFSLERALMPYRVLDAWWREE